MNKYIPSFKEVQKNQLISESNKLENFIEIDSEKIPRQKPFNTPASESLIRLCANMFSEYLGEDSAIYTNHINYLEEIKALINKGANIDVENDKGFSPLLYSCMCCDFNLSLILLMLGAKNVLFEKLSLNENGKKREFEDIFDDFGEFGRMLYYSFLLD
jgi:hypothetical protein